MKKKILILLVMLSTCLLFFAKEVYATSEYTTDEVVVEDGYDESYLTFHHEVDSQIKAHTSYIDTKFSGGTTIVVEAKFGVTPKYVMALVLSNDANASQFTEAKQGNDTGKAVLFGSYKGGYVYFQSKSEVTGADISSKYNDGINPNTLFYSKTSYKIIINENGNIDVYAKLTESLATFLSDGGNESTHQKLSSDYIHLYTLESFYSASFIENGYYIGFNVNMGKLAENDVILHHLEVYDSENEILFADNFSHFELVQNDNTNGYYSIPSNVVRQEYGKSIVLTKGKEYTIPHFDVNNISRSVNVGDTLDLTPTLIGLEGNYTITVNYGDEVVQPIEGNKYNFDNQGVYKVLYSLGSINRELFIKAIHKSTQPNLELNFSKELVRDKVDTNSTIVDGKLKLSDGGYFYTKGRSEGFILNLKLDSLTDSANLSIVVGKDGNNKYSLKLTENGIMFIDYFGKETLYECENIISKMSNEAIYIRVTLLGGVLSYAAISESQPKELLNVNLVTISDILFVGQVGLEVSDGDVNASIFQFVNLTDVKNDNTVTVVPETPKAPEISEKPEVPVEEEKDNKVIIIVIISVGVLAVAGTTVFLLRKKIFNG